MYSIVCSDIIKITGGDCNGIFRHFSPRVQIFVHTPLYSPFLGIGLCRVIYGIQKTRLIKTLKHIYSNSQNTFLISLQKVVSSCDLFR